MQQYLHFIKNISVGAFYLGRDSEDSPHFLICTMLIFDLRQRTFTALTVLTQKFFHGALQYDEPVLQYHQCDQSFQYQLLSNILYLCTLAIFYCAIGQIFIFVNGKILNKPSGHTGYHCRSQHQLGSFTLGIEYKITLDFYCMGWQ